MLHGRRSPSRCREWRYNTISVANRCQSPSIAISIPIPIPIKSSQFPEPLLLFSLAFCVCVILEHRGTLPCFVLCSDYGASHRCGHHHHHLHLHPYRAMLCCRGTLLAAFDGRRRKLPEPQRTADHHRDKDLDSRRVEDKRCSLDKSLPDRTAQNGEMEMELVGFEW